MNGFLKSINYITRKMKASRISAYAAQTAFFMFLSLIPLIMLLLSLLKQIGTEQNVLSVVTNNYMPGVMNSFFDVYLDEIINDSKVSLTIVSAVILLWSASRGIYSIIGGLNSVYEIKENRNYFLLRLIAVFYTLAFVIILVGALLILVFGDRLNDLLYSFFPDLIGLVYIISSLRFIIGFVILVLFFTVLYKLLPSAKQKFSAQIPGALFAGAGWITFSILFTAFVENFGSYANIYGSLSAIIVLLLWLYVCMYILFIGAELNLILSTKLEN